jgi:GMP synthase (glutamine-hydrolysing)
MKKELLVINVCQEKLHYFEFVKPIEDILQKQGLFFFTKHYSKLNSVDLKKAEKVIICGTSLKDNNFLEKNNLKNFEWIRKFDKPILGICAGMQIIGKIFGGKIINKKEIGFFKENFVKDFFGLKGEQEVWHLHNNLIIFDKSWENYVSSSFQACKHKEKEIYCCLFHPEVRNKHLITNFSSI